MEGEKVYKAHVVVLAYPLQGHINSVVQFSKRLASKGIKITVTTTLSYTKKLQPASGSILFESIYDDTEVGTGGYKGFLDRFEANGLLNLTQLIKKLENSDFPVKCLVYDANIPWASNVVKQLGIPLPCAAFFTQSCAAIARYYPMYCEFSSKTVTLPAFPIPDLPQPRLPAVQSLGPDSGPFPPIIQHLLLQFNNIENADWVLFNSFDKLEEKVVKWMSTLWPVRTIGPSVPSAYLDKRVENDIDYGFSLHNQNTDACMKWLNTKETGSVIYVSFGSAASLSSEQMVELATALKKQHKNNAFFLWVVRPNEQSKLPVGFVEETSEKGLVVSWCSQLEVLAHPALGCFVSHCGWNSTLEAISFGVPMVAMPQFLDQMTNAYFVEHVWGVGIEPKADEQNLATAEEIGRCISEVMQGERGQKIKENAICWKELAKEAIDEAGSSDKYLEEIIAKIVTA